MLCMGGTSPSTQQSKVPVFGVEDASRYAALALNCLHREYPNKIAHVLHSDQDAAPPSKLTPAFYGCYDWHSAVHSHWMLVRVLRRFPSVPEAPQIRAALAKSLTSSHIEAECAYLRSKGRETFERPYGLAWLLMLAAELRQWDDDQGRNFAACLAPLETHCAQRFTEWLPKLSHPVRTGEHSQTAFALGLAYDWASIAGDAKLLNMIEERALLFHTHDQAWPMRFEPSGQDFLSPGLAVADLMRRVLEPKEFAQWLTRFLPELPTRPEQVWLLPAVVTDKKDGKLAHLDGLNLSRAWMLEGIAQALDTKDLRRPSLLRAARDHREAGLAAAIDAPYEGSHWLGSFAIYLVTERGLGH